MSLRHVLLASLFSLLACTIAIAQQSDPTSVPRTDAVNPSEPGTSGASTDRAKSAPEVQPLQRPNIVMVMTDAVASLGQLEGELNPADL